MNKCPYCNSTNVSPSNRKYALCADCHRHSRIVVYDHADASRGYELRRVGRRGRDMVRATFWIERWQKDALAEALKPSEVVRRALNSVLTKPQK